MFVLVPPSETKDPGGTGAPLCLQTMPFPALTDLRAALVTELVALCADHPRARTALKLSEGHDAVLRANTALWTSPTMPAARRYTGVLYDALDAVSLRGAAVRRLEQRLLLASALFGLLRAADPIPAYRLSAASRLGAGATLTARWRPVLRPVLAELCRHDVVVDLRSGAYAALGPAPAAVTVQVLAEDARGGRSVVSHHNKAVKGRVARVLCTTRADPGDAAGVAAVLRRAGLAVERDGLRLTVVVAR